MIKDMTMTWKPDICIHHSPCDDGFGAAWCVWRKWGEAVEYRPSNYGQAVPDEGIDGKNILIVDFSFKPNVLRAMAARAASIVVLDHHKTAQEDLGVFPVNMVGARFDAVARTLARVSGPDTNIIISFDMMRSGAMMAWNFCFPEKAAPVFIRHLQDRDLWKFEIKDTRAVSLWLRSFPYDFEIWSELADRIANKEFGEARAIERFYDRKVAEIVPTAMLETVGGWEGVPVAHAPYSFASDVCHELLLAYPAAPFVAVKVHAYGTCTYSLRSTNERQDVSAIARQFGGGGHRNAAGFRQVQGCGEA